MHVLFDHRNLLLYHFVGDQDKRQFWSENLPDFESENPEQMLCLYHILDKKANHL